MASEADEFDPGHSVALDQDPEAIYFLVKQTWIEWDARVVQRAAEQCVTRTLRPRWGREGEGASPPALPLTTSWLLLPDQGRSALGRVLGEMRISTAKKRVLQSIAGQFLCNAVLHKWGKTPSAACTLYGHPAETQSHIQCLCPPLRIRAQHNIEQRLWKGIKNASRGWTIVTE
jgi:hypothetical protein